MTGRSPVSVCTVLALAVLLLLQTPTSAARRVILMIGDGMGFKHVEATRNYLGHQLAMEQLPVKYACTTYEWGGSYNSTQAWSTFSYVAGGATDSASAATALSTGIKADDGNIATTHSDTHRLLTTSEYVRMNAKSAGVVSSVPFSHATPACFAAHNNDRGNYTAIAREMITTYGDGTGARGNTPTVQVVIGGGHPTWASGYIGSTELTALRNGTTGQGWTFVERATGVNGGNALLNAASTATKLFGLYGASGGNLPYRLANGSGLDTENPTLAQMSAAALTVLERDPDGFFLMIEGGAIDWASHSNNMNQMIGETIGFDEAVQTVVNWVNTTDPNWSDTLLIVTADHETGYITRASGTFANVPLANPGTGVVPTSGIHFAWNSTGHTNSLVPLYAKGAGSELFEDYATQYDSGYATYYLDNTKVAEVVRRTTAESFRLTATADQRGYVSAFDAVLLQMQAKVGGIGAFHVSPGDIDPPNYSRIRIDARFGTHSVWYPGIGNHEAETAEDMTWLRTEYNSGNGGRVPLKVYTNQDGPTGTVETNYSWDYGNVHFIMLNQYWDGGTVAGSDVAADGDVVPALRNWLAANLAATAKPVIIVFGHEPAYPFNQFVGDSLDKYPANRDAFWNLLESDPRVKAYICGHTNYYSKYQKPGGRVWQIDLGNAGNDNGDGKTFLDVVIDPNEVRFDIWRDGGTGTFARTDTWSVPATEPVPVDVASPSAAKAMEDATYLRLTAPVSAAFPDFFYMEDEDRVCGIRVNEPGFVTAPGVVLTVTGTITTNPDGERCIEAMKIVTSSSATVKPVGMTNLALGGGAWQYNPSTYAGQRGVSGGVGANNIGLLARIFGEVTYKGTDHFYVDDGSGVSDGSGHVGVRVAPYGAWIPSVGTLVQITGVSSCYASGGQIHRLLRYVSGLPLPPFVAYNDVVWNSGQPIAPNVTTYGIGSGFTGSTSGPLLDFATGTNTGITCAFTESGGVVWQSDPVTGGSDTNPGTDAYNVFNGIVSLSGLVYYGSTGWWVDVEIAGLDPAGKYEFVTTSNRNDATYTTRLSRYTISGVDSFTNTSTPGVTITNGGASTAFCTGYNTASGYVARWTNIAPGSDGKFKVRAEVAPGGDAQKAYAFDAFKLARTE